MSFDISKCSIPTVYCGNNSKLPSKNVMSDTYYTRFGTRTECVSKGFGAGAAQERLKLLPKDSLQRIKYVGEAYEKKFKSRGIKTGKALASFAKSASKATITSLLKSVFTKKNGVIDKRAWNSTLVWLSRRGHQISQRLPSCKTWRAGEI